MWTYVTWWKGFYLKISKIESRCDISAPAAEPFSREDGRSHDSRKARCYRELVRFLGPTLRRPLGWRPEPSLEGRSCRRTGGSSYPWSLLRGHVRRPPRIRHRQLLQVSEQPKQPHPVYQRTWNRRQTCFPWRWDPLARWWKHQHQSLPQTYPHRPISTLGVSAPAWPQTLGCAYPA